MNNGTNPLIIALDVESDRQALELVETIGPAADFYKVGLELYAAAGMNIVRRIGGMGKRIFLDLKLYDIGETVKRATREICRNEAITFLTVHAVGPVMRAAVEGKASSSLRLLGVTVLTSFSEEDLREDGCELPVSSLVDLRVRTGMAAGIDGFVCSPLEAARVRSAIGPERKIVTPGVRSAGMSAGDQKRVATPAEAIRSGANYVVLGRQVTRAENPRTECERVLAEIRG